MQYFQDLIQKLTDYWQKQGCAAQFGYDLEVGAGTFNPATFFRSVGPEPYNTAYVEPSRRPSDGRYGVNPNRMQHFFQFQVILKPSPLDIQKLYLNSLKEIGLDIQKHDIRFVHDDWKSPSLGAWGLGWEVWVDGMEVSQFTYFQQVGGIDLEVIPGEITYGLERIATYLQGVDNVYDLKWNSHLTYGDIYRQNEIEWSTYNFEESDSNLWKEIFETSEKEALALIDKKLPIPAYDFVLKTSHAFNMLDARGVISVAQRTQYINRVRQLACLVAKQYLDKRKSLNFPLLKKVDSKTISTPYKSTSFDPDKKDDFLLEIGIEELPQSFVPIGIKNLKQDLEKLLLKEEIAFDELSTYGSPRRLVAYIKGLSHGKKSSTLEKKGPAIEKIFDASGNLNAIGRGFLDAHQKPHYTLKELHQEKDPSLQIKNIGNASYLYVLIERPKASTHEIFSRELAPLILNLDFPQKMIWSDLKIAFPRPLRSLIALHGKKKIVFSIAHVISSNFTYGHPALAPEKIVIQDPKDYFKELKTAFVIVDQNKREKWILDQIQAIEKKYQVKACHVAKVMKEVLYLSEYPHLMVASFDEKYLEVPKELLELVIITHQKHFPLQKSNKQSSPQYIVCLDTKASPLIKKGHQKAVNPRLSDGLFLFHQDQKIGLDAFAKKLSEITFQEELGSVEKKSKRLFAHAKTLNGMLHLTPNEKAIESAAHLLKADLASHAVFEFPELQGTMGAVYAEYEKRPKEIVHAICEHWLPRFEEDILPKSPFGILFSLADKMDNLLSCFLTSKIPSSSSDPFALRRQMLGIIRILIEHKIHLPLRVAFESCLKHFDYKGNLKTIEMLLPFLDSRLKTVLTQYQLKSDEVTAVIIDNHYDVYDIYLKALALNQFKKRPLFKPLFEVFKRAKGQLHTQILKEVQPKLFETPEEKKLYSHLLQVRSDLERYKEAKEYLKAFELLATFQPLLSQLFEKVKILTDDEDLRINRLALLSQIQNLFNSLLDFSVINIES